MRCGAINNLLLFSIFLAPAPCCLSSSLLLFLLSVNRLSPEEDESSEAFVFSCFPVFLLIGEYISLDLFHLANPRQLLFLLSPFILELK